MDKYIRTIVEAFIHEQTIVMSWGMSNPIITHDHISFYVYGIKHTGTVTIYAPSPSCFVTISGESYECAITELITFSDNHIEKTADYQTDLENWINAHTVR